MSWQLFGTVLVGVLTSLAVIGRAEGEPIRVLVGLHAAFSVAALVFFVVNRRRLQTVLGDIGSAAPVVATGLVDAPSQGVAELLTAVRALGFELAGVTDTRIGSRSPIRTWVLVEPSGETWVEVGQARVPLAIFLSATPGGRQVETAFPTGEPIDEPGLIARSGAKTPSETLEQHRILLAAETQQEASSAEGDADRIDPLGTPPVEAGPLPATGWRVANLEEYLAWEVGQRARNGGMRIRAHIRRAIDPGIRASSISVIVDAACLVALWVAVS